jgi:ribonuclease R
MEEIGLDPYAVNNRGVVTVDENGTVLNEEGLPPEDDRSG